MFKRRVSFFIIFYSIEIINILVITRSRFIQVIDCNYYEPYVQVSFPTKFRMEKHFKYQRSKCTKNTKKDIKSFKIELTNIKNGNVNTFP